MKKILILLSIFLAINTAYSQKQKMKITLNNGIEKTGIYKIKTPTPPFSNKLIIKSIETNEKYTLDEISSVIVYDNSEILYYKVIDVKFTIDDKKTEKKLGLIIHQGSKTELFSVSTTIYNPNQISNYDSFYIIKNKEAIAYNIGYIYGIDARPFKRRIREFFTDCQQLIDKVENNEFNNDDALNIAVFYDDNCGK